MKKSTRIILIILCSLCSLFISLLFLIPLYFLIKAKPIDDVKADDKPTYLNITKPKYKYINFNFEWFNDDADKKYSKMKDDLVLNDDYDMTKKELLDEYIYENKVYRYLPTEFDAYLKDGYIYDDDNFMIGKVKDADIQHLVDYVQLEIVYYFGKHKYLDFDDNDVYVEKGFNYFTYRIKKEVQ